MIKKFLRYYKKHIKLFLITTVCAVLIAGIDLLFPALTNIILTNYLEADMIKAIIIIGIILLGLYLIRFLFAFIVGYYGHTMGLRLENDMRSDLFRKFLSLDYSYFDDAKIGTLMSNLTTHLNEVSEMSHHVPEEIIISTVMIIGSFIYLMFISPLLTLIVFASLSCLIIFSMSRRKKMMKTFDKTREAQSELFSQIESGLGGIRLTKALAQEKYEEAKFEDTNQKFKKVRTANFKEIGLYSSGNNFFISLANLVLLIVGAYFVYEKYINAIELTTYFLYVNLLIGPIGRLVFSMELFQHGYSGIKKFYSVMDINPKIEENLNNITNVEIKGNLVFSHVYFQYSDEEDSFAIKDFNLNIKVGEKVALIGETGVGKTTISKLVPRFYDVNSGKISIDGYDIKSLSLSFLRNSIGLVQQDVYIHYGSIKENILYGNYNASEEELINACKSAQLYEFIISLPNKFETIVGDKGVKLSGGQKQRISIARLFLRNPKILLLDEATSSLDNKTESKVQLAFDTLALNKTTIIIAHRLSTIKNVDRIIVLGREGILEEGNHKTLLEKKGYYYDMISGRDE